MMRAARWIKISSGAIGVIFFLTGFASLFSQNTQSSPTPGVSPVPSPSATRTPQPRPTPSPFPGAQNFHKWGSITVFNGLPSDSVRAIAQTPDGVMWFGTDNGLARFDGRRIQNFSLGESDKNGVSALTAATSGDLWIGTESGAFVYSGGQFRPVTGSNGSGITSILLDGDNYIGSSGGMVCRVTTNEQGELAAGPLFVEPILAADGTSTVVTSLTRSGDRLLASTSGRGVFVIENGQASEIPNQPAAANNNVNAIINAEGELWMGTEAKKGDSGIYRIDAAGKATRIPAPTAMVNALTAHDGDVWAGSDRYGLYRVTGGKLTKTYTFENTAGGLRSDTIFALFFDREGILWIGTNRGVSRYDAEAANQQTVSDIPNSNFIRTLSRPADGSLLFAGSNRGLFSFNGKDWKPVAGFADRVIYAIAPTASGLTIGTSTGTADGVGRQIADGDTRAIQTFQGVTYAAIYGLGVINLGTNKVIFNDNAPTSLLASDRLWIGTSEHGLFSYDGTTFKNEIPHETLRSGTIWKIIETADQKLWVAGQHGVFRVNDGQAEKIFAADEVRDVYVDGADVWAATTTRGLLHARHNDRFGWIVTSVGFEQGMPSDKAFSILPSHEGLMIATNRGVTTYRPHDIVPKIIATRVVSQQTHDLSETAAPIALDYPQNSLLVEVAGLSSRTFPEEFQYAFVLTDSKGKEIDRRIANDSQYSPTSLGAGDYQIEVIAFNRDLIASEPLFIRYSVAKAPFPWTATALAVLLLLAVAGLVWAVVEHRRMRQRNRDLAAARLDLANEAERERRRIARDLHDQTLADLRNLMMMSDKLAPEHPGFRSEIESVSSEIRRICEDLSPSVLENVGLVAALQFLLEHTIESSRFSASDDLEENIQLPLNAQLQVYRIAQEVLNNITSHSDADEVEMSIDIDDAGTFRLSIADNGHPFSPDGSTPKGRGIANIKARASLINARIQWRERRKGGNRFSLTV